MRKITLNMLALLVILSGCVASSLEYNAMQKTQQLQVGMMHEEVVQLLGKPKSVQFVGDKVALKYGLHQEWKGWVPFYTIFEKKTGRLLQWYSDEAEYQRRQNAWMSVFKEFEQQQQAQQQAQAAQGGASGSSGSYVEGYDPNANYYTNDYSWEGSGYHYDD